MTALNLKLEGIISANSQFQLKIDQLEIQLNSVTSFLKQQFGDAFALSHNHHYYLTQPRPPFLGRISSAEAAPASKNNEEDVTNSIQRPRRTKSTSASGLVDFVFEDTQPIPIANTRTLQHQDQNQEVEQEIFLELPGEVLTDDGAITKIELDPFEKEVEQMSPNATDNETELTEAIINDPLGDLTHITDSKNIDQQQSNSSVQQQITSHTRDSSDDRPFICDWPKCTQRFAKNVYLKFHRRIHTGEKPWPCDWPGCKQRFAQQSTFIVHKRIHTGEKPYICDWPGCKQRFAQRSSFIRHKRIHTGEKPYVCDWPCCKQRFSQHSSFILHKRVHTGEKPYICDWKDCGQSFTNQSSLKWHKRTHTTPNTKEQEISEIELDPYSIPRPTRRTKSHPTPSAVGEGLTDFVFEDVQPMPIANTCTLQQKQDQEDEQEVFVELPEEDVVFDGAIIKIELDPFEQEDVGQMVPNETVTETIINDPLGDLPAGGENQQSTSLEQQSEIRHTGDLMIHTREKPYACDWPECGQRFRLSNCLTTHKRTHTGEKPYACDWPGCKQKFVQQSSFSVHKRIHTGEKPYMCDWKDCGQRFRHLSSFNVHKRNHTGSYQR